LLIRVPRDDPPPAESDAGQKTLLQHGVHGQAAEGQAASDFRD
jgi:hypothetical protein